LEVSLVKGRRHQSLTQETLKVPKISVYGLSGEKSLEVLQVDAVETWMTPYQCYLPDGMLSKEPTKAKADKRNAGRYTLVDGKLFHHGYTHLVLTCVMRIKKMLLIGGMVKDQNT